MKTFKLIFSLFLVFFIANLSQAQPYLDGNKRYSFAQMVLGLDFQYIPNSGTLSFIDSDGALQNSSLGQMLQPRFTISGLHFWGHAEFYLTIPFGNLLDKKTDGVKPQFSTNVETGMRLYPWRIEAHKLRPFIGISWNPTSYQQTTGQSKGSFIEKSRAPIQAGFTFNHKNSLIELGATYYYNNKLDYYINRDIEKTIETPPFAFHVGYKFYFDTTIGASKALESGYIDKKVKAMSADGLLNGLSVGLGLSSATFTKASSYNNEFRPYLGNHKSSNIFLEFGLGYYFFKRDFHLNMAYRNIQSGLNAYGVSQSFSKRSLAIEGFKFLGDYHGFVPFVGPVLSFDRLAVVEREDGQAILNLKENKVAPGIIFGWDIRPHRLQSWVLRTNLRYFPKLDLKTDSGFKLSFDNLEFNFIQFVYYPGVSKRIKHFSTR